MELSSKSYLKMDTCYNAVIDSLTTHLPIKINGKLTAKQFFTQLVCLATHKESIHSSSKLFPNFLSETALRHHLKKFDMESLTVVNSDLLLSCAKQHLSLKKKYQCAIDFTDDPYYGKIDEKNEKYIVKSQNKNSTNKFYAYATLSLIEKNEKFTLAVLPVEKGYKVVDSVRNLLKVLDSYPIIPEVLCMDAGFYGVDVMRFLQEIDIPFIIPVRYNYTKLEKVVSTMGQKQKCEYVVTKKDRKTSVNVTLGVIDKWTKRGSKNGIDKMVYATYGVDTWSVEKIARTYIHRFSIESSYRIRNQIKPKTSTKNTIIRYLFALISFIIENVWISFQLSYFTKKQRGPKVIDEDKFPLSVFLMLINEKLREILGQIRGVEIISIRRRRR